ncbi:MAG: hypothetical protein JNK05_25920 [Myxococcales bacterium]|nr:hypothetical protein [Myxococcales bacterium]
MVDDEEPKSNDGRDDEREDEDRDVILARRKLLVSAALAGVALPAEACDWLEEKFRARSQPCLSPPVAPNVCLAAQVCLSIAVDEGDSGIAAQSQPCLSVAPEPCLSPPAPRVCLRMVTPSTPRPVPTVCLSRTAPRLDRPNEKGSPSDKDDDDTQE